MARSTKKKTVSKAHPPSAAEVEASLHTYDENNLECREMHWWVQIGFFFDAFGDIRRRWRCVRCKTVKTNRMSPNGAYVGNTTYKHPDGYKVPGVKRQQVRAEKIRRAKVYASEASMLARAVEPTGNKLTYPVRHQRKTKVGK